MKRTTATAIVDSVLGEGAAALNHGTAEDSNFLPSAARILRVAEPEYGNELIRPIVERLSDNETLLNPASRFLLGTLSRLVPNRQAVFERSGQNLDSAWRSQFPTAETTEALEVASSTALNADIHIDTKIVDVFSRAAHSASPGTAYTALRKIQAIGAFPFMDVAEELLKSEDPNIQQTAVHTAARLSALDERHNTKIREIALDGEKPLQIRRAALEAFAVGFGKSFGSIKAEALLEPGVFSEEAAAEMTSDFLDTRVPALEEYARSLVAHGDIQAVSTATLRRLARDVTVSSGLREAAMSELSSHDLTEELSRTGLLIHRNSSISSAFIGHTGILVGENRVIDANVGRGSNAVQEISLAEFRGEYECWGIREDYMHPSIDLQVAIARAREINSWRTEYDGNHLNQKGEWIKGWFCSPEYWECDCVGLTEHCYEYAGGGPVPAEHESGLGWPLTPREQRDHMRRVFDC